MATNVKAAVLVASSGGKLKRNTNMPVETQGIVGDSDPTSPEQDRDRPDTATKFVFDAALSTAISANDEPQATVPTPKGPLIPYMLDRMNRYWRAANYLCIGQIYLFENPLLREPLKAE